MLGFLFRKNEIEVLRREVHKTPILVVGPMGSVHEGDPTLLILIKILKVDPGEIAVIDNQGGKVESNYVSYGDIYHTRDSLMKLTQKLPKFVLGDALKMSFKNSYFETIIDRITHKYIFRYNDNSDDLYKEYHRVLSNKGRVIFFCERGDFGIYYRKLIDELPKFGFKILRYGKCKPIKGYIKYEEVKFAVGYQVSEYIIASKD
jgi:SAM-dependent methyltransferase